MSPSQNLKSAGLKTTLPRLKILELFQKSPQRHLGADDIYRQLLSEQLDIGLATIYRALSQFEQAGVLARSHFDNGKAVFELNEGQHHDHLVCLQCGHIEEFCDEAIEKRQAAIAKKLGFVLHEHALALYGNCTKENCEHLKKTSLLET